MMDNATISWAFLNKFYAATYDYSYALYYRTFLNYRGLKYQIPRYKGTLDMNYENTLAVRQLCLNKVPTYAKSR